MQKFGKAKSKLQKVVEKLLDHNLKIFQHTTKFLDWSEIMLGEITIQKMATELKEKQVRQIAMHAQCQVQIKRAEEWKQDFMTGQDGMKKIMEQYKDAVIVID